MEFDNWGESEQHEPPIPVSSRGWSFLLEPAGLTAISFAGRELIAKLFFSVRDASWATPVLRMSYTDAEGELCGFSGAIAELGLSIEGTVRLDGDDLLVNYRATANRDVEAARIGPAVLHEFESLGPSFTTTGVAGAATVPTPKRVRIARVASGYTALHFESRGVAAGLTFGGAEFEMEDQRNWGDSTLKSYCPPLGGPLIRLPAGSTLEYTVTISAREVGGAVDPVARPAARSAASPGATAGILPSLGLAHSGGEVTAAAVELLRELGLGYLHLLVDLSDPRWRDRLTADLAAAEQLGIDAVLSVNVAEDRVAELDSVAATAHGRASVAFVFPDGQSETTPALAQRAAVAFAGSRIAVGGGSRSHFASLAAAGGVPESVQVVGFPLAVASHDNDRRTLAHAPQSFAALVREARHLSGDRDLLVGPVGFRATFDPWLLPDAPRDLRSDWMAGHPRDGTVFAGAWTIAALGALAGSGVRRVTIGATVGDRGVLAINGNRAARRPAFDAVRDAAGFAGLSITALEPADRVAGFETAERVLLGDLTDLGPSVRSASLQEKREQYR